MLVPVQLRPPVPYLHLLPIVDVLKAPNHGAFFLLFFELIDPVNIFANVEIICQGWVGIAWLGGSVDCFFLLVCFTCKPVYHYRVQHALSSYHDQSKGFKGFFRVLVRSVRDG